MQSWASSGATKIERAKEHIADFASSSRAFLEAHPYLAVSQYNSQRRELTFSVQSDYPIPARLASIVGDAAYNLRSSLDILWRQVWSKETSGNRKEYFPFFDDTEGLEGRFKSVKPPHNIAVNILRAVKPYKSGNKMLFALREISNTDKHEKPVLAAAAYKKVVMKFPPDIVLDGKKGLQVTSELASGFLFLKSGTPLPIAMRVETDAGPLTEMECTLSADISFGQAEVLEGEPVLTTLQEFAQMVDGITDMFLSAGLICA